MDAESSHGRRAFLRHVALGGGVAVVGGIGGATLADRAGTFAKETDVELFTGNGLGAGEFELRTAWNLPERGETIPSGQGSDFPTEFSDLTGATLGLGSVDPGGSETVLAAYELRGNDGIVDVVGTVTSTNAALESAVTLYCWPIDDWADPSPPAGDPAFSGPMSAIDETHLLRRQCSNRGGVGFTYELPAADEPIVRDITPGDSLRLEIELTAKQCSRGDR